MKHTSPEPAIRKAYAALARNHLDEAEALGRSLVAAFPDHFESLCLLGVVASRRGRADKSADLFARAVTARPLNPIAHNNLGNALRSVGRLSEGLQSYLRAIELDPRYATAQFNCGAALLELGQPEEAIRYLERAVALRPNDATAELSRGSAFYRLDRPQEALSSIERALSLNRGDPVGWNLRGMVLHCLRRYAEALNSYDTALALDFAYAEAHYNRGISLMEAGRGYEAVQTYRRAIALAPDFAEAHNNLGNTLRQLGRHAEARSSYERALSLNPKAPFLAGMLLHLDRQLCNWRKENDGLLSETVRRIERGEAACPPFVALALTDDPTLQRRAAETWMAAKHPRSSGSVESRRVGEGTRLRIGYYSADFHAHATSYLIAELLELHDRTSFEIIGLSFGPSKSDALRKRIVSAFDQFIDVREMADDQVACLSRTLGIDIAVDLNGLTAGSRPGIFSHRAAPIQVSFLGYPGTTGAQHIDYLIADRVVIPTGSERHYSEKIVRLPFSYQVNDRRRPTPERLPHRRDAGLPEGGFVFCCFNNSFKLAPDTFDVWMSILREVEGSALWLLQDNPIASENLKAEAVRRRVSARRIVFAPRTGPREHLARQRLADLFLDTLPYNAHTTASDALWAGLPVISCAGESFAGRVGASLLSAMGLSELIVTSMEQYRNLAVELARDPTRLESIRRKLTASIPSAPLFDTPLFARHIEEAYRQMYRRLRAGTAPDHIDVPALGRTSEMHSGKTRSTLTS